MGLNGPPSVNPGVLGGINAYQVVGPVAGAARSHRQSITATYPYPLGNSSEYYCLNGSEGTFEPYNVQQASQLGSMPGHEASSDPASMYPSQEQFRQWVPGVPQQGRVSANTFEDGSNSKLSYGLPLVGSTPATAETHSVFPGMSTLASSLPPSQMGGRILPSLRSNANPSVTAEASLGSSHQYNLDGSVPVKSDLSWIERSDSISTSTGSGSSLSGSSLLQTTTSDDQKFAPPYGRFRAQNTSQSGEQSTAPEFAMTTAASAANTLDEQMLPSGSFGNNSYTYSLPSDSKQPSASDGTLLSGQTYTPLPHRPYQVSQAHHQILGLQTRDQGGTKNSSPRPSLYA
ncbi:MAG: hypothetical protein LQ340_004622 [Diploschistes diacapsis]|nr:MAG: hypothetical protein LQ340_004622 [Diploschistes diacapsis]